MVLALGCLALLTSFASTAMADAITFSFVFGPPVTIDTTGLNAGPALVLLVSDTKIPAFFPLTGSASVSTGPAAPTTYQATASTLSAQFLPGVGTEILVLSGSCTGGAHPGTCLSGSLNSNGKYAATLFGTGSFQALFQVDYVSPYVTSLFGDPNSWLPQGSDSLNTAFNMFTNGGSSASAILTGGAITFQTSVPEPGTLALCGSGILGLAGLIRRKLR
jgi:hypothetical protein